MDMNDGMGAAEAISTNAAGGATGLVAGAGTAAMIGKRQAALIGKIRQPKEPVGVSAGKFLPEHSASQETPSQEHKPDLRGRLRIPIMPAERSAEDWERPEEGPEAPISEAQQEHLRRATCTRSQSPSVALSAG
jgi:hypothetical protein